MIDHLALAEIFFDSQGRICGKPVGQIFILPKPLYRREELVGFAVSDEQAGDSILHQFRIAAGLGRDDRRAHLHRFNQNMRQTLVTAVENKNVGRTQIFQNFRVRQASGKNNSFFNFCFAIYFWIPAYAGMTADAVTFNLW